MPDEISQKIEEFAYWTKLLAVDQHSGSRQWMMVCEQPGQLEKIGRSSWRG